MPIVAGRDAVLFRCRYICVAETSMRVLQHHNNTCCQKAARCGGSALSYADAQVDKPATMPAPAQYVAWHWFRTYWTTPSHLALGERSADTLPLVLPS